MSDQSAESIPPTTTLEQCHDSILQGLMQGTAGHYRIGRLYKHMVDYRLAVNRGYRTTREYFRRHVRVLSQSTLTMYGQVARKFPLAVCEKYGMASLGALLDYARLACIWHVDRNEPGPTPIQIPRKGGLQLTKPFSDCTAEDLRQAVLAKRARPGQRELDEYEEHLQRYIETLKRHFAEQVRCPPDIEVHVHDWRVNVRLRDVWLGDMEQLANALQPALKPIVPVAGAAPSTEATLQAQPTGRVSSFISSFK